MRRLKIAELDAGMVLAADVGSDSGHRILSQGTVVTERQIELLTSWQIGEVAVEDEKATPEGVSAALSEESESLKAAKARLAARFEGAETNEYIQALHAEAEKRLTAPRYWKTGI